MRNVQIGIVGGSTTLGRLIIQEAFAPRSEEEGRLNVRAVHARGGEEMLAHLLNHDTVYGPSATSFTAEHGKIIAGTDEIVVFTDKDSTKAAWQSLGIKVIIDASGGAPVGKGHYQPYFDAGVRKVFVAGRVLEPDLVLLPSLVRPPSGYDPDKHHLLEGGTPLRLCLAAIFRLLRGRNVEEATFTAVEAISEEQQLHDSPHPDPRLGRAAMVSIVPIESSLDTRALEGIMVLEGEIVRGLVTACPALPASLVHLVCRLATPTTAEEVNAHFRDRSLHPLQPVGFSEEALVGVDHRQSRRPCVVDGRLTQVFGGQLHVGAWYGPKGFARYVAGWAYQIGQLLRP